MPSQIVFTSGNLIECQGTMGCDLTTHICCVSETTFQGTCVPAAQGCPSTSASFGCVQGADCTTAGDVCCAVANESTSTAGSTCQDVAKNANKCTPATTSTAGSAQICQTDAECKNGMPCVWQVCSIGSITPKPNLTMCGIQSAAPFNCVAH